MIGVAVSFSLLILFIVLTLSFPLNSDCVSYASPASRSLIQLSECSLSGYYHSRWAGAMHTARRNAGSTHHTYPTV